MCPGPCRCDMHTLRRTFPKRVHTSGISLRSCFMPAHVLNVCVHMQADSLTRCDGRLQTSSDAAMADCKRPQTLRWQAANVLYSYSHHYALYIYIHHGTHAYTDTQRTSSEAARQPGSPMKYIPSHLLDMKRSEHR